MKNLLFRLWNDEEGAEIAEWVVVVALLVAIGFSVYNVTLQNTLTNLVTKIGSAIDTITIPTS